MDSSWDGSLDTPQIVPDSPEAVALGYTSDKFQGYLGRKGKSVYIWQVRSRDPGKGNFSRLVQNMLASGLTVKIPTPIGKMRDFVRRGDFVPAHGFNPEGDEFEVWVKEPA
ncbi:MAG: hypothetical protein WAW37_11145 [Syntrophobacteraceae bacterium]